MQSFSNATRYTCNFEKKYGISANTAKFRGIIAKIPYLILLEILLHLVPEIHIYNQQWIPPLSTRS